MERGDETSEEERKGDHQTGCAKLKKGKRILMFWRTLSTSCSINNTIG